MQERSPRRHRSAGLQPALDVLTNNPGAWFGVLATTNLALPQTNWTWLGGVVEVSPGQFQFTDPQATNNVQRYYNLFAP
jgi:hypothetical protein